MPKRIQRKRAKGWRMPANAISVTRPGRWGNPFIVSQPGKPADGTAQQCVDKFRGWIATQDKDYSELKGKDLACWCKPGAPCHADVLLDLANQEGA